MVALNEHAYLVAEAESQFIQQACLFSAIALLLCETIHSADLELQFIWARGRARLTLLFITIRHVQLASVILNTVALFLATSSLETCTTLGLVSSTVDIIPYFGWAVFLGWRAYALSSRNTLIALLVFVCSVSFVTPSLFGAIATSRVYTASSRTCSSSFTIPDGSFVQAYMVDVSRSLNLLAEVAVLILTCRSTYHAWISSRRARLPTSLPSVLYENGMICFSFGVILHAVSLVFSVDPLLSRQAFSKGTISLFRDTINTVFLSRFLLELAKIGESSNDRCQEAPVTRGILTTEWTGEISEVPSQWTLDDEYNGRGFDKDVETFDFKEGFEA